MNHYPTLAPLTILRQFHWLAEYAASTPLRQYSNSGHVLCAVSFSVLCIEKIFSNLFGATLWFKNALWERVVYSAFRYKQCNRFIRCPILFLLKYRHYQATLRQEDLLQLVPSKSKRFRQSSVPILARFSNAWKAGSVFFRACLLVTL